MTTGTLNTDPLFETPDGAEYLSASIPTLERWRRVGQGPDWCKMGGMVRYRRSALDRYIESTTRTMRRAKRSTADM